MAKINRSKYIYLICLLTLTLIVTAIYSIMQISLFLNMDNGWTDKMLALILLIAEFFIFIHGIGYFLNITHVVYKQFKQIPLESQEAINHLDHYPPIAVVIASYKEPLSVIQDTLTCLYNLTYPNKHLYLLDDTRYDMASESPQVMQAYRDALDHMCQWMGINIFRRKWHHAKAGIINDLVNYLDDQALEGSHLQYYEKNPKKEKEKYLIVFDVDMNALPGFIEPLADLMEKNPKMAFIQTPQYYSNFATNRVARTSGLMQVVFYEYICEAKGIENAMFCCGTNFIIRMAALKEVGGFDQTSVTEDFATSFSLHSRGWQSSYINQVCAFGLGPEDLGAFFKQQYRWAFGTISLLGRFLKEMVCHPTKLSLISWWQYILSASFFLIGIMFFIMLICPIIYLFFNTPAYLSDPWVYAVLFGPYIFLSNLLFYWTLIQKNYGFLDLFKGVILMGLTYPIYIRAAIAACLGRNVKFIITPKGKSSSLPLWDLWPQILTAVIAFSAIIWGGLRLYYEQEPFYGILFNIIWVIYYFAILSCIFYFNQPLEKEEKIQFV